MLGVKARGEEGLRRLGQRLTLFVPSSEMPYIQLYSRSSCQPREVLVNILKKHPQETAHFFKPSCVVLRRCAGCCNDDSLKCFAVTKRSVRLQVRGNSCPWGGQDGSRGPGRAEPSLGLLLECNRTAASLLG